MKKFVSVVVSVLLMAGAVYAEEPEQQVEEQRWSVMDICEEGTFEDMPGLHPQTGAAIYACRYDGETGARTCINVDFLPQRVEGMCLHMAFAIGKPISLACLWQIGMDRIESCE